jgi:hypothetical protein
MRIRFIKGWPLAYFTAGTAGLSWAANSVADKLWYLVNCFLTFGRSDGGGVCVPFYGAC